jgi:hypothetical protein
VADPTLPKIPENVTEAPAPLDAKLNRPVQVHWVGGMGSIIGAIGRITIDGVLWADRSISPRTQQREAIRRDRGEPLSDIARSYNVSPGTISRLTCR